MKGDTYVGVSAGRSQAMQIQQGLIQVLLYEKGGFHSVLGFTSVILRWLLHVLEDCFAAVLVSHFQEMLGTLALLLAQFTEKVVPRPSEPHPPGGNRSPERGRYGRPVGVY